MAPVSLQELPYVSNHAPKRMNSYISSSGKIQAHLSIQFTKDIPKAFFPGEKDPKTPCLQFCTNVRADSKMHLETHQPLTRAIPDQTSTPSPKGFFSKKAISLSNVDSSHPPPAVSNVVNLKKTKGICLHRSSVGALILAYMMFEITSRERFNSLTQSSAFGNPDSIAAQYNLYGLRTEELNYIDREILTSTSLTKSHLLVQLPVSKPVLKKRAKEQAQNSLTAGQDMYY
ncbi:RNA-directed RNA polymerase L [Striga asiatica]|uniref:RNA-directed RNA polymerase L n=1 Tax=Striga asiatica TaxID=4170 RepID=A0A5A7Q1Q9_STRAF|nr:RNA-directed RNA polymerase L [Striga asiatica]